jgi:hypothetical protein
MGNVIVNKMWIIGPFVVIGLCLISLTIIVILNILMPNLFGTQQKMTTTELQNILSQMNSVKLNNPYINGNLTLNNRVTNDLIFDSIQPNNMQSYLQDINKNNVKNNLTIGSIVLDGVSGMITSNNITSNSITSSNITSTNNLTSNNIITTGNITSNNIITTDNIISKNITADSIDGELSVNILNQVIDSLESSNVLNKNAIMENNLMSDLTITGNLKIGNTLINANDNSVNIGGKLNVGNASLDASTGNLSTTGFITGNGIKTTSNLILPYDTFISSYDDSSIGFGTNQNRMMFYKDGTLRTYDGTNFFHIR